MLPALVNPRIALLIMCLTAAACPPASAARPPTLSLSPCELHQSFDLTLIKAECGRLSVPENPARPQARRIDLAVAVVPAVSTEKRPDPLFVLAGGPGMGAISFYTGVAPAFEPIRRDRDIVLVDQRGTGGSNALECALSDQDFYRTSRAALLAETRQCLRTLRAHAHVRFYTTTLAVNDLDRVRAALGYERIDLYGSSYGTVVAQEYVRRFPGRVRSVILDGVVPPQVAIGAESALDAQTAVSRLFARCARESPCRARFGDPAATYRRLSAQLARHPVWVELTDPTSGVPSRVRFTSYQLEMVLRLASYTPTLAALLPLDLHEAASSADFGPLAGQFLLIDRLYGEAIAAGMNNTVVCAEDVPFYHVTSAERARLARTFLGTSELDALREVCSLWPRGPVDPEFHAPLHSEVPALLLSGSNDPITPPRYAAEASRGFARSLSLVVRGFGHGQLTDPCVPRLMAQFLERASVSGLATACLRKLVPTPFFLTRNGPSP